MRLASLSEIGTTAQQIKGQESCPQCACYSEIPLYMSTAPISIMPPYHLHKLANGWGKTGDYWLLGQLVSWPHPRGGAFYSQRSVCYRVKVSDIINCQVVYAAYYWLVRIIDVSQINYYQPPKNKKYSYSTRLLGMWPRLELHSWWVFTLLLRNTGCHLSNEYFYWTNSMQRSRHKNLES